MTTPTYCPEYQGVHRYAENGTRVVACTRCGRMWPAHLMPEGTGTGNLPPHFPPTEETP